MSDKKVVLAIDDNVQQLSEFKNLLIPDYDLRVVKGASEAIAYLNKHKSDVILLDIEMPNIDGFEVLADIKKIPSYIYTPIIIVSGTSGADFKEKAKSFGAVNVLHKPVTQDDLIKAIEKALDVAE